MTTLHDFKVGDKVRFPEKPRMYAPDDPDGYPSRDYLFRQEDLHMHPGTVQAVADRNVQVLCADAIPRWMACDDLARVNECGQPRGTVTPVSDENTYVGVRLQDSDFSVLLGLYQTKGSYLIGAIHLTPTEARALARLLTAAANAADN